LINPTNVFYDTINNIDGSAMIPNLDIDQLKTFLAIADTGSFTRAAEEVNKTQSAVSMQMKRLEEAIGRSLFVRDGRGSRFSRDGERFVEQARKLVAMNDEIVAAFTKPELTGSVRFGTPDDYADLFLPEVLGRFARSHPQVTVDVECLPSERLMEKIKRGDIDIALVTFHSDTAEGEVLRREELVWVTSARHSPHTLDPLPIATSDSTCSWRRIATAALESVGRRHRVAYTSPNRTAIDAAVMQGLAVAAIADICVRPGMRLLRPEEGFPKLGAFGIGLVRRSGIPTPATEALARHIRESFGGDRAIGAKAGAAAA
jgi:DNA-binding transcriptional LysR family regulator